MFQFFEDEEYEITIITRTNIFPILPPMTIGEVHRFSFLYTRNLGENPCTSPIVIGD